MKSWKWFVGAGLIVAVAAVAILAFAQKDRQTPSYRDRIVASVNGTPISVARFNESYVNYLITTGRNDTPENRFLHLNNLLDTYLLAEEARRRGMAGEPEFAAYYDRKLRHTVGGQFYSEEFLSTLPPLTDEEVRLAFSRSKESIMVRHLLFRDPSEADRAYARLQAGEDFIRLANEVFETAVYDSMAGYLGLARYWDLDDSFAEAAFSQPIGVPTTPIRSSYGYHIILVEDHLRSPFLAEDEYQYRKKGIESKARQRKLRIEGGNFIQEFMSKLNVQVNSPAIYELREAVTRLSVQRDELTQQLPFRLSSAEVAELEDRLTPETVLLTYELDGEKRSFTALEYYHWLEELPFHEARNRTAASVGRALRNEVLALKGFEANLDQEEIVQDYMEFASRAFLARALRQHLRENERAQPTKEEVEEAFTRLGYRQLKKATADFWLIKSSDFASAEEIRQKIEGGASPSSFPGYAYHSVEDLEEMKRLGGHIRRALMHLPSVVGIGDGGWYVFQVDDRDLEWTTLDEKRDEIEERLATRLPEARLAGELRETADVSIDTTLFREMMKL